MKVTSVLDMSPLFPLYFLNCYQCKNKVAVPSGNWPNYSWISVALYAAIYVLCQYYRNVCRNIADNASLGCWISHSSPILGVIHSRLSLAWFKPPAPGVCGSANPVLPLRLLYMHILDFIPVIWRSVSMWYNWSFKRKIRFLLKLLWLSWFC